MSVLINARANLGGRIAQETQATICHLPIHHTNHATASRSDRIMAPLEIASTRNAGPADLSVVIVSWNVADLLTDCIKSILSDSNGVSCEIFVVDNASTDGTVETVRGNFADVRLIANS